MYLHMGRLAQISTYLKCIHSCKYTFSISLKVHLGISIFDKIKNDNEKCGKETTTRPMNRKHPQMDLQHSEKVQQLETGSNWLLIINV